MRRALVVLGFVLAASSATGETVVETCFSGMPSSEGGETTSFTTDGDLCLITVTLFGHTGRFDLTVTPTGENDATLHAQLFTFEGLLDDQANPIPNADVIVVLQGEGRAIVQDGAICDQAGCFLGNGTVTKDWLQEVYDNFTASYSDRFECTDATFE